MAGERGINTDPGGVGGDDGSDIWLGVPTGYSVTRPSGTVTSRGDKGGRSTQRYGYSTLATDPDRTVMPRYRKGDESKPPRNSPEYIAGYQQEMIEAGLLKKGFRAGRWDEETIKAWKKVLEYANRGGLSSREALDELKFAPMVDPTGGGGGAKRAPFVAELPNPDDIRKVAEKIAPTIRGRNLDIAEVDAIIREYNAVTTAAQRTAYNAAPAGGTVTDPPDVSTFIENKTKELHPEEADTFSKFNLVGDVMAQLGISGTKGTR